MFKLADGQFENAKIKVQSAKLRNPDVVGMFDFDIYDSFLNWASVFVRWGTHGSAVG